MEPQRRYVPPFLKMVEIIRRFLKPEDLRNMLLGVVGELFNLEVGPFAIWQAEAPFVVSHIDAAIPENS